MQDVTNTLKNSLYQTNNSVIWETNYMQEEHNVNANITQKKLKKKWSKKTNKKSRQKVDQDISLGLMGGVCMWTKTVI